MVLQREAQERLGGSLGSDAHRLEVSAVWIVECLEGQAEETGADLVDGFPGNRVGFAQKLG